MVKPKGGKKVTKNVKNQKITKKVKSAPRSLAKKAVETTSQTTRSKRSLATANDQNKQSSKRQKLALQSNKELVDGCFRRVLLKEYPEAAAEIQQRELSQNLDNSSEDANNNATVALPLSQLSDSQNQTGAEPLVGSAKSLIQSIRKRKAESKRDKFYSREPSPHASGMDRNERDSQTVDPSDGVCVHIDPADEHEYPEVMTDDENVTSKSDSPSSENDSSEGESHSEEKTETPKRRSMKHQHELKGTLDELTEEDMTEMRQNPKIQKFLKALLNQNVDDERNICQQNTPTRTGRTSLTKRGKIIRGVGLRFLRLQICPK